MSITSTGVKLRPATLADWPQLVALDQAIFGHYGAQEEPAIIRARLSLFPAGCVVLEPVSETDGPSPMIYSGLLGYLTTEKWPHLREPALDEDPAETHDPNGTVLNITTLAIAPHQQNRGLGAMLVAEAIAIAQREGCTTIVLETAHATAFYCRHGFTEIGQRQERNIRLYIMMKEVD